MAGRKAFDQDRNKAYDRILAAIRHHIAVLPPAIITDLRSFSTAMAKDGAARESWGLYAAGILYLKCGAPQGRPGRLNDALIRASVRNASLAAGLGIRPPVYESTGLDEVPAYDSGAQMARFCTKRLLEAAEADLALSRQHIATGLAAHNPAEAFGEALPLLYDPELARIAKAAKLGPDSVIAPESLAAMRKQMVLCFNFLMDAYAEAGRTLRREIDTLN